MAGRAIAGRGIVDELALQLVETGADSRMRSMQHPDYLCRLRLLVRRYRFRCRCYELPEYNQQGHVRPAVPQHLRP